jgi:hypothetical protein
MQDQSSLLMYTYPAFVVLVNCLPVWKGEYTDLLLPYLVTRLPYTSKPNDLRVFALSNTANMAFSIPYFDTKFWTKSCTSFRFLNSFFRYSVSTRRKVSKELNKAPSNAEELPKNRAKMFENKLNFLSILMVGKIMMAFDCSRSLTLVSESSPASTDEQIQIFCFTHWAV